jgi:type VI secretion system secreted protein VgrG
VNGQEAKKANGRELTDPVEAFAKPVIVLDTSSSQAWASDASIASFAGQDISLTSQGDHHETAAHTHTTVAGETASFYTHAGGIKTFAANGPLSLRAHTDELQILADKDVTVVSVNGEIHITAKEKIEIVGADSSIVLEGANITFTTPGTWAAKASAAAMLGGSDGAAPLPALPADTTQLNDEAFRLVNKLTGEPVGGLAYTISSPTGALTGYSGDDGMTHRVATGSASYGVGVKVTGTDDTLQGYPSGLIEGC